MFKFNRKRACLSRIMVQLTNDLIRQVEEGQTSVVKNLYVVRYNRVITL